MAATLLGTTTLPESNQLTNHALVFMVGAINSRWKQVIAYHFTGAYVPGDILKDFVFKLVKLCEEISLCVWCVTCDMGSSHRAMGRALNLSNSRNSVTVCSVPHPCDKEKELFFLPDPAHVLKNIRGHLVRNDVMQLDEETLSIHDLPSAGISISHVQEIIRLQDEEQLQVAPKLSAAHVSDGHFTKMKVGIAVQLFRESPDATRYFIEKKKLPADTETTAWFFELVFKWYTVMTGRHPVVALSFLDMQKYKEAISALDLASQVFRGLCIGVRKVWMPCQ
ncbi:hypothetical protein MTO96_044416 [Rhipicephalus appendiculatus]